ncbi:MAG: trehalose synthase [Chitinophagaceae bacterium]|nr:MAG: trehalose synthase [Chitinophagaceae bacterium]
MNLFILYLRLIVQNTHLATLLAIAATLSSCSSGNEPKKSEIPQKWYRNSIIYNLDVDTYQDGDGDGVGDFKGLIERLPYLSSLGVDVVWLSPFQPSPNMDDGYDITDFYGIDPRLGNMKDFEAFMAAAKSHGIKIVMDMVLNHTSIEHAWFKRAREDSTLTSRSRYVWSNSKPKDFDKGMVFPGIQTETWTYDEISKKFYFHRFYDFQPDLNYQNKEVQHEAAKILKFWIGKGINGFRLDAVPFIIDIPESGTKDPKLMFNVLDSLVHATKTIDKEFLLLGEANVAPKENIEYFGKEGERLSMMFNFYVNQYLFYSLAKEDPTLFVKAIEETRAKPVDAQWAFFLRNHDEIDLARLSKNQRKKVFDAFGPETNMQLYDRGIRRRLATMLDNPEQLKMAYSLLYSLPRTPVIRSGEEIGMGDDLTLRERLAVRTPMQWNASKNAGFSTAEKTIRPVISQGKFSYKHINVAAQLSSSVSLLQYIRKLIHLRKKCPEIGQTNWQFAKASMDDVVVLSYPSKKGNLIILHNFSSCPKEVDVDLPSGTVDLLTRSTSVKSGKVRLKGFGTAWLRDQPAAQTIH